jgi:hypothetical protein
MTSDERLLCEVETQFIQVPSNGWTRDPSDGGVEGGIVPASAQMSYVAVGHAVENGRGMMKWLEKELL